MQINFSTQVPEYHVNLTELPGATEKFQPESKNTSSEARADNSDKLQHLQNILAEHNINLKFTQHEETKQLIVQLVDSETGDAIRQMPSELSLKLSAEFAKLQGQLVDEYI
jgi:flagellar protein FlaG